MQHILDVLTAKYSQELSELLCQKYHMFKLKYRDGTDMLMFTENIPLCRPHIFRETRAPVSEKKSLSQRTHLKDWKDNVYQDAWGD